MILVEFFSLVLKIIGVTNFQYQVASKHEPDIPAFPLHVQLLYAYKLYCSQSVKQTKK